MANELGLTSETLAATPDIFASEYPPQQISDITILAGADLVRGTLLGKITSSGKYTKWDNRTSGAATDGSQNLVGVLAHDCLAASAEQKATMYISGDFNKAALNAVTTVIVGCYNNLGTINIIGETA